MEMEIDFAEEVLNDFNEIRTKPTGQIKRFETLQTGMKRFKGSEAMVKELDTLIGFLKSTKSFKGLERSPVLDKAAEALLDQFAESGYKKELSEIDLTQIVEKFAVGYTKLAYLGDEESEEPVNVINKTINSKWDIKEKKNRKTIFSTEFNVVGIATRVVNKSHQVAMIFADAAEPAEMKPLDVQIHEYINNIRSKPSENVRAFERNGNKDVVKYLNNAKPTFFLQNSDILRDLAFNVLENSKYDTNRTLKNLQADQLREFAKSTYSGYNELYGFLNVGDFEGKEIVHKLLQNDNVAKNVLLESKGVRYYAIAHLNDDNTGNTPVTVLLFVDYINEGGDKPFEQQFADEFNRLRLTPETYTESLTATKNELKKYPYRRDVVKAIDTMVADFNNKKVKKLPPVKLSQGLNLAASELLDHLEDVWSKEFYVQDDEFLNLLIKHYVTGFTLSKELINVGGIRPSAILTELLVTEDDSEAKSRKSILDAKLLYIGVGHRIVRSKAVTIIVLTDRADELQPAPFAQGLVEEINHIRSHPKTFAKYFKPILENPPKSYKSQLDITNFQSGLSVFIDFLKKSRTFAPFDVNELLKQAADARVNQYVEERRVSHPTDEDLRAFLSDFASKYNAVSQVEGEVRESPREWLVNFLAFDNAKGTNRELIFSKQITSLGVSHNEDQNIFVAFFADNVEETENASKISVHTHRRRIRRPDLTDDEIAHIKKDFRNFDVLVTGFIKPGVVQLFMDNSAGFAERNPVYYKAIGKLNTDENNSNGVDVEEFINAVKNVLDEIEEEEWSKIFTLYTGGNKKRAIDFENLKYVTKTLGYRLSEEELSEIVEKITDGSDNIDNANFVAIMSYVQSHGSRAVKIENARK